MSTRQHEAALLRAAAAKLAGRLIPGEVGRASLPLVTPTATPRRALHAQPPQKHGESAWAPALRFAQVQPCPLPSLEPSDAAFGAGRYTGGRAAAKGGKGNRGGGGRGGGGRGGGGRGSGGGGGGGSNANNDAGGADQAIDRGAALEGDRPYGMAEFLPIAGSRAART